MKKVTSSCIYCGCGCKLKYKVDNNQVVGVAPEPNDHISEGKPCIKGLSCYETFYKNRLSRPQIRKEKTSPLKDVSWEEAYSFIKENLSKVEAENITVIGSGSLSNEDNYLISKFGRSVLKTNNVDTSARLCHAATVAAAKEMFGISASPDYVEDLKEADFTLTIGTNPVGNYPVIFNNKIKPALDKGGVLVSVDVEPSDTLNQAKIKVLIEYQGITAFLGGLLYLWFLDQPASGDQEAIQKSVERFDPEFVAEFCGIAEKTVTSAYASLKNASNRVVMFGMGLTQHADGTENATTVMTLAEIVGAKIVPMRGKINIQGSGDVGASPPSFVPFEGDNEKINQFWGVNPQDLADGKTMVESFLDSSPAQKAFIVFSSDPAKSLPDLNTVHQGLQNSFVVCAHNHPTKMLEWADVVLPLTVLVEEEGTYTNAEREVRKINAVAAPYQNSRPAWKIICDLAKVFGSGGRFNYQSPREVFEEITKAIPAYAQTSWEEEKYADKRKKFVKLSPVRHLYPKNPPPEEYPVVLTTARSKFHFCTGEATLNSKTLLKQHPEPTARLSAKEASKWGIEEGDRIKVTSEIGALEIKAKIDAELPEDLVIIPFHFDTALVNSLTSATPREDVDEESGTPNYKVVFVRIEKV